MPAPSGAEIDPSQRHGVPLERAIIDHSGYKHVAPPEHVLSEVGKEWLVARDPYGQLFN